MTEAEFNVLYGDLGQKTKVEMSCNCGRKKLIYKEKAQENIDTHNGIYICRACSMISSHATNPRSSETREKQRIGRVGKQHSGETKKLISDIKNEFYKTDAGKRVRRKLSVATSKQHGSKKFDKSKRKILYISAKNGGDIRVCNSSYEYIVCEDFLEKDDTIVSYETQVPYNVEDRGRSLDFLITYANGDRKAIEVKPLKRLTEEIHVLQMYDSRENAKKKGWNFEIWTEKEIGIVSIKAATARADVYRKENYLIDYAAYRQQKDRDKANRHYQTKIAKDKVIVFCDFCNDYHAPLRLTYDRNIARNARYVCERLGGHIAGSKPKKKKENPFADLGQKKCIGECDRVLPFECFSAGKSQCKECRAKTYKQRYQNGKTQ